MTASPSSAEGPRGEPGKGPRNEPGKEPGKEPRDEPGGPRPDIAAATRVVVKVGSSSLTTAAGEIADDRIASLAAALAARRSAGIQVVLVSSGAIASGLVPLGLTRRPSDLATQQAAASVGQGLLIARYTVAKPPSPTTLSTKYLSAMVRPMSCSVSFPATWPPRLASR